MRFEAMSAKRVQDRTGSHIEPELDESWSDLEKLRWNCGVAKADADIVLRVESPSRNGWSIGGGPVHHAPFQITWANNSGMDCESLDEGWRIINALTAGAELYRDSRIAPAGSPS